MENCSAGQKKFLIVEDEPAVSDVCRRILTREGYEVDVAVNGRVAQDVIEQRQYDFCLIDIRTPVMNGWELYWWLQEKHPRLAGGVIFTTGDVMGDGTQKTMEQVDRPFLAKPFTPNELRTIVKETVRQIAK